MKTTLYAMLGIVMLSLVIAFANMSEKSHQAELKQNPNYRGWYTVIEKPERLDSEIGGWKVGFSINGDTNDIQSLRTAIVQTQGVDDEYGHIGDNTMRHMKPGDKIQVLSTTVFITSGRVPVDVYFVINHEEHY